MSQQTPPNDATAVQLAETMAREFGTAEIEFVGSLTAPIFWIIHDPVYGEVVPENGSIFFLDTGACVFGVTAAHVVISCLEAAKMPSFRRCLIARHEAAPYQIDLRQRVIDFHEEMDIATVRFSRAEVRAIGRTLLLGCERSWPPPSTRPGSMVTYAGWPGAGRTWLGPRDLKFGLVAMAGTATVAHDVCISIQIERDTLERVRGDSDMPDDFDFGGMSGGPVLRMVEKAGFLGRVLAGVIFEGPNPSGDTAQSIAGLEIIRLRPAHFINDDGTLDVDRWRHSKPLTV